MMRFASVTFSYINRLGGGWGAENIIAYRLFIDHIKNGRFAGALEEMKSMASPKKGHSTTSAGREGVVDSMLGILTGGVPPETVDSPSLRIRTRRLRDFCFRFYKDSLWGPGEKRAFVKFAVWLGSTMNAEKVRQAREVLEARLEEMKMFRGMEEDLRKGGIRKRIRSRRDRRHP